MTSGFCRSFKLPFLRKIFVFLIIITALERFCHWQTGGLRMGKVAEAADFASQNQPVFAKLPFNQPYDFLGKGAQFYAFGSRDGQYVLKLFKTHHGFFAGKQTKEKRRSRIARSTTLAVTKLQHETGILALHLQKTDHLYGSVLLHDRLHIAHPLCLDDVIFVLQKRAETAEARLRGQLDSGNIAAAKRAIAALVNLAGYTSSLGVKNKDLHLLRNSGFVGEEALLIDIGSLSEARHRGEETKVRQKALLQIRRWVQEQYPQYEAIVEGFAA
jgi:hypothetical protein